VHHPRESASAFAFLIVIPEGNLLLHLHFWLSFPKGICFCICISGCHSQRESASVVLAAAIKFCHPERSDGPPHFAVASALVVVFWLSSFAAGGGSASAVACPLFVIV
jgi:hypothetical protein